LTIVLDLSFLYARLIELSLTVCRLPRAVLKLQNQPQLLQTANDNSLLAIALETLSITPSTLNPSHNSTHLKPIQKNREIVLLLITTHVPYPIKMTHRSFFVTQKFQFIVSEAQTRVTSKNR
jgi:hypothetical protein